MGTVLRVLLVALSCFALLPIHAVAKEEDKPSVGARLLKVEAALEAQHEARDRQADAFDAAVARMEFLNAVLVAVIAIAGIGGSLLAIQWVRQVAHNQVAAQIDSVIRDTGKEIFEAHSSALRDEFEEKFSRQYLEYERLLQEK